MQLLSGVREAIRQRHKASDRQDNEQLLFQESIYIMKRQFRVTLQIENDLDNVQDAINSIIDTYGMVQVKQIHDQRSNQQNRALHKWCEMTAQELNEAGLDIKKTLSAEVDHPWTGALVKELMYKKVLKSYLQKDSTTELTKVEPSIITDILNRFLGEKWGLYIPFPSEEYRRVA